jgi:hypothetical protein
MRRLEVEDSELPDSEVIELVIRDIGLEYISRCSILVKKNYMRQIKVLYMSLNISVQQFVESLNDPNAIFCIFWKKIPSNLIKMKSLKFRSSQVLVT